MARPVVEEGSDAGAEDLASLLQAAARPAVPTRPVARPEIAEGSDDGSARAARSTGKAPLALASLQAVSLSQRPSLRPPSVVEFAMAKRRERRRGAVCGDLDIQGDEVGLVPGNGACGIDDAVKIRSVSGISLSQQSLMDCGTAKALNRWVSRSAIPSLRGKGGGLVQLRVAAHYACRTRNSQTGARIPEHGKGRAIDISGFRLRNGTIVSVLHGWDEPASGQALKRMHREACGPFGTVLGPEADRFHRDHFHFDTARYRNGTYCR